MAQFITIPVTGEKKARFRVEDILAVGQVTTGSITLHMRGGKDAVFTIATDATFASADEVMAGIEKAFVLEDLPYHEDKGYYQAVTLTNAASALDNLA